MKHSKTIALIVLAFLVSPLLQAQQQVDMADGLRSEGKIYVVVAIMLVVFTGVIVYLFTMDRKVSRLEKKFPEKKS